MDDRTPTPGGTARRIALTTLATVLIALGITLIGNGARSRTPPPQPGAAQAFGARSGARGATGSPTPTAAPPPPLPPSAPTTVRIPAIHVAAPMTGLGLERDGRLEAPPDGDRNLAGWYRDGTAPGAVGTAIVAGHVDTEQGKAVFYDLGALRRGATVEIGRADGRTAVFTVDAVEVYRAAAFPDREVYGNSARPELRLITCGGGFDKKRQEYEGNVVAYAHLTGTRP